MWFGSLFLALFLSISICVHHSAICADVLADSDTLVLEGFSKSGPKSDSKSKVIPTSDKTKITKPSKKSSKLSKTTTVTPSTSASTEIPSTTVVPSSSTSSPITTKEPTSTIPYGTEPSTEASNVTGVLTTKESSTSVETPSPTTQVTSTSTQSVTPIPRLKQDTCVCDPKCDASVVCASNKTAPRTDCPCCSVCLVQEDGDCSLEDRPCDSEFGLACKFGKCQYLLQVNVIYITSSQITLKLNSNNKIKVSYTESYNGNKTSWKFSDSKYDKTSEKFVVTGLKANTKYHIKVQATDSFKILTATTSPESERPSDKISGKSNNPQILVTKVTPGSISIGWDDFKLPSDARGYVVEYKLEKTKNLKGKEWMKMEVGDIALTTLENLNPNVKYKIRVSTFEDFESKKMTTNMPSIVVKTEDGCIFGNNTYLPDDKFDDGCKSRCTCRGGNKKECAPICTGPYFRAGTFEDDPYCFENPTPDEPCCVLAVCSSRDGDISLSIDPKQAITFATNDSSCPTSPVSVVLENEESCPTECSSHGDCKDENNVCCSNICGGMSCTVSEDSGSDRCSWTICGPSSKCVMNGIPECVCLDGFKGDPNDLVVGCIAEKNETKPKSGFCPLSTSTLSDKKCVSTCSNDNDCTTAMKCCETTCGSKTCVSPLLKPVNGTARSIRRCSFKNKFYGIDQEFYDGCEYKCRCSKTAEIVCDARCPHKVDQAVRDDPLCTVNKDPEDSCCEIAICAMSDEQMPEDASPKKNMTDLNINPTKKPSKSNKLLPIFDGCVYKNKTYKTGGIFYDGCSSRCECGGFGAISCIPRCPLVHSPGPQCSLQPDPEDSCCKIPICDVPGDVKPHKVKDLKIILESIIAKNATVVRVTFTGSNISSLSNDTIQIWYIKSADLASENWHKIHPVVHSIRDIKSTNFYADVYNLDPGTMYYFRIALFTSKKADSPTFSNAANIKTFPELIQKVFEGCFRGNNTYEADEEFYDGCDYKCRCNAGGKIKCQDRCTQYDNTAGYEHCTWQPSPDDNCCLAPVCNSSPPDPSLDPSSPGLLSPQDNQQYEGNPDEAIPSPSKPKCTYNNKEYPVKATWEIGSGCLRGICVCVENRDGTAKVDCVGGCPHIPNQLTSTPECPNPKIVPADEPCVCPAVSCNRLDENLQKPMCPYKSRQYNVGEEFYDGCDGVCMCTTSLRVHCQPIRCPRRPTFSACVEWEIHRNFIPEPPNCCPPPPVCKNDGSCIHQGKTYRNFQKLPPNVADCGVECVCRNGNITCTRKCALPPRIPPPSLGCPPDAAVIKPTQVDTEMCCMMWTCVRKPIIKQGFRDVKITPLNDTSIRVRFVIPQTLVGHRGHAEISYTFNPTLNVDDWFKKRFSRPQNIFDTTHIEYHLTNLRPNVMYLVKLAVISHETKEIIQSEIIRVRTLPPVQRNSPLIRRPILPPPVPPSDRLPPNRHLPPQNVKLDMKVKTEILSPTSVKVMWRLFDSNEREVITGVKVVATDDNGVEKVSPLIHQAVQSYEMDNLNPNSNYKINLNIVTHDGEPITFHSTNDVTVKMPKDKFDMEVNLKSSKISPHGFELKLDGIPKPASKYVNIVQVSYQSEADPEAQSSFYKVDKDTDNFVLKSLKPGSRYKVWPVLYLSNGKSMKLDTFEVNTLPGSPENQVAEKDKLKSEVNDKSSSKSYYTAFVVIAILAALVALAFLAALYMLLRKQSSNKAPINHSQQAYNNPTYKSSGDDNYSEQNHENKLPA